MPDIVTATALIDFSAADKDSGYHLSAAVDDREDGFNGGKTSFTSGDAPAFLVWAALGRAGRLAARAHGGELIALSQTPAISTLHEERVVQLCERGRQTIEVELSPPACETPAWNGPGRVEPLSVTSDGYIGRARIALSTPVEDEFGEWIVGRLTWRSLASAWRIRPAPGADGVALLVAARPGE